MINFFARFINNFTSGIKGGATYLPVIIAVILSVAFIAMLIVTIFTIVSMRRVEKKAKRVIDIPPSARGGEEKQGKSTAEKGDSDPWPVGEWLNKYLISNGYINVNSIAKSFFKSMDFLKASLGTGYKYKLPWYMIVGTEESGKSSLMSGFTHDEIYDDEHDETPCTWWFLKNGVVLDVKGSLLLPKEGFNADDKSWHTLLNLLIRYRAEKPLNGIILTIPASELYGRNKLPQEEINRRALYIAKKLGFAQNYMGMKLPVYIVVTKTDVIPGFQSFCSEIPVRNRTNMLGWSSPYAIDVIYNSKMIDDGFSALEDSLNEIRMEIFSESFVSTTRDGVFVFPSELLTIKSALGSYIDALFKSSSVEEKFYFRGFYFTGDSKMVPLLQFDGEADQDSAMAIIGTPDADLNEAGSVSASLGDERFAPKKIFFFEDLLLKKVFPEEGVASPMRVKVKQYNKSIFVSKISTAAFVVIGSYGLFNAIDQLRISKNNLYPSLFKISSLIKSAGDLTYKNLGQNGNEILADCTSQLLSMMQQLNNARFSSLFVPASWFSSINNDLTETLRVSYQRIVVRTIYMNLVLKSRDLLNQQADKKSSSITELLNPHNSAEYLQLKDYVFGLIELEKNIKKFDSLRTSGDQRDLADLIDYTFNGSLPTEFLDNYRQFRSILMNTPFPPIDLSPYRGTAYNLLVSLFQNFLDTIFTNRSENSMISFLHKFINQLSRQNLKEIPDCSYIIKFSKDLTSVCKELGEEGSTWLDKDVFEADKEFDTLLDGVEALFGRDVAQKMLDITAVNFGYLKARLAEFNDSLKNDIPSKNPRRTGGSEAGQGAPSSGIYLIERCLSSLCAEPFMETPGEYQLITHIPDGKVIFWDDELVQYAYDTGTSYEQFMATNIKDFPRAMQEGIALVAKTNLCAVVASTIAKSQSLVNAPVGMTEELTSEEILQRQVAELKGVAPRLVKLLKILRDDKFAFVFGNLRSVLNEIGFSLLSHVDKLLENQKPYYPNNLTFNFWNGEKGAGLQAFSAADMEELILYLKLQRSLITRLAIDFAAPIVEFLDSGVVYDKNYGSHTQLTRWARIVDNVNGLEKKDPTSSVAALEKFIRRTMNDYTINNISSKISLKDITGESGDYFLNIIRQIKKGMMSRAEVLIRKRNIERYKTLRDYYTKHLEGKYPFSNYDKSQRTAMDADLEAVKEFFKMYDEFGGTPESVLDQIYQLDEESKEAFEFLKKINELKLFFGDSLKTQSDALKIRLEINFSVNKREETNTDYLVDRVFKPNNDSSIEPITKDKTGIWYFGEPIELDLRWASGDDQADKPVYDQNDPDLILEENTAKIQCVGNWAVLRFLQKYKSESANTDQLAPNQVMLGFKVPLNSGKIAKIFAGVTPALPKKPGEPSVISIKLPGIPGEMPEMPSSVESVADEPVLVEKASSETPNISEEDEAIEKDEKKDDGKDKKETEKKKDESSSDTEKTESADEKSKEKVLDILTSEKTPEIKEEESVIEVSEEPIE